MTAANVLCFKRFNTQEALSQTGVETLSKARLFILNVYFPFVIDERIHKSRIKCPPEVLASFIKSLVHAKKLSLHKVNIRYDIKGCTRTSGERI